MCVVTLQYVLFFFNNTATTEIYTLSLHDALPIFNARPMYFSQVRVDPNDPDVVYMGGVGLHQSLDGAQDRKSTRLNSSHRCISYAVFCLKKKINSQETTAQHHINTRLGKIEACA